MMNKPIEGGPATLCRTSGNWRIQWAVSACLMAAAGAALSGPAYSQTAGATAAPANAADTSGANTGSLEEVVVTATPVSGGIKKLDASYSISTASLEEIRNSQPSS